MPTRNEKGIRLIVATIGLASALLIGSAAAQTIIDQWSTVTAPPPPSLQAVTIDKRTTALLMLDFNQQTCNMQRRPRCIASIPKVKTLLAAARAANLPVIYTLGGGGKPADIASDLAPAANDPIVSSGVDKFVGTELEKILSDKGVNAVIVVGTAANGAVLYTASSAAMRKLKVIVPVDGVSGDNPFAEQYLIWHFATVPVIGPLFTLTTIDQVKF